MATYIDYTVKTTVTYDSSGVTTASFDNCIFVSTHNLFTARAKAYSSASDLLEDGFTTTCPAYKFATGIFSGKQAPSLFYLGRAALESFQVKVDSGLVEDDVLTITQTLNGVDTEHTYTVLVTDTTDELVATGLAAVIEADAGVSTATADSDGLITIVPADVTTASPMIFEEGDYTTVYASISSESPAETMAEIVDNYSDYTVLCSDNHDQEDIKAYASYVESNDLLYVYTTDDTDVGDAEVSTDIFSEMSSLSYQYSMGMYHTDADTEYPEGAILGTFLSKSPSYNFTLNQQTLVGISTDSLSTSFKSATVGKNGSYYVEDYGSGALLGGYTANGDFFDRSRFGLWIKLRSEESMANTMKTFANLSSSLAYSDAGIAIVKANILSDVINVGITNGSILTGTSEDDSGDVIDYTPVLDTSTRASQSSSNITSRLWTGFEITVYYTGSIHHIATNAYILNN